MTAAPAWAEARQRRGCGSRETPCPFVRQFGERGVPAYVRSDNGPEFIAKALMRTLAGRRVEARHIEPGSPWQNGRNERFNGSLRDECLNPETFHNRDLARALIKLYGRHYNERRPHSSLGYWTPTEFARKWQASQVAGTVPAPAKQD